jgi:hypothetical protein
LPALGAMTNSNDVTGGDIFDFVGRHSCS